MAEEPEPLARVQLQATWVGLEEVPILFANQVIIQLDDQNDVIIGFGQANPPVVLGGTVEEQRAQIAAIPFVQIRPVARLSMSTRRLEELIRALQETVKRQQQATQQQLEGQ